MIKYVKILPAGVLTLLRYSSRVRYIRQFSIGSYKNFAGTRKIIRYSHKFAVSVIFVF